MSEPLLTARGVTFGFAGHPVIGGADLSVHRGELVALVGPSGVGKSTLLRLLAGLIEPNAGEIVVAPGLERNARCLGYVPQDFGLVSWLTAAANVELALRPLRLGKAERSERCQRALTMARAASFASKPVCRLSGGMQQRVALARALAGEPRMLLLDEPFSGIDWWTRRELQENLVDLQAVSELAVLVVTHDLDEALRLADRVLVLQRTPSVIVHEARVPIAKTEREERHHAAALAELRLAILDHFAVKPHVPQRVETQLA